MNENNSDQLANAKANAESWREQAELFGNQLLEARKRIKELEAAINKMCMEDDPFEKERITKSVMERKK